MRLGRLHIDGFLVAISAAVALAAVAPRVGASGGPLHLGVVSSIAIALVFFLHGALLPLESLARGARHLRLHVLIQLFTFGVFPALGALVLLLGARWLPGARALRLFLLCAVSSPISSSVALTAVAGGNVPGALFNATLSGILGVLVTPAYASLVASTAGLDVPLPVAIGSVALKVLLPLLAGQLCRARLAGVLARHHDAAALVDRGAVVLIVYGASCDSFGAGVFRRDSVAALLGVTLLCAALFGVVLLALRAACHRLGLSRSDEIAAVFCGTQKSIANGLPIAKALFGALPDLGMVILPMIIYHQLQLAIGSVLARRYAAASRTVPP
jgi:sodium/bile acid cotransporter 7